MSSRILVAVSLIVLLLTGHIPEVAHADDSAAAATSSVPYKKQSDADDNLVSRAVASLVAALAIGLGGLYLARRFLPHGDRLLRSSKRRVTVVEKNRLSPKTTLVVVEFDDETLLLGLSDTAISVLSRKATSPDKAAGGPVQ